ncbi:MAG TPA: trypsin-like peptidase domain-containing protein [Candidatus Limnocylindrales bacterium]|jgi:S1-C subfamily serine protease
MNPSNPADQPLTTRPATPQDTTSATTPAGSTDWNGSARAWEPTTTPAWQRPPSQPIGWAAASAPAQPAPAAWPAQHNAAPAYQAAGTPSSASGSPRNRRAIGTVLGTALLAALIASGSTFALVEVAVPHAQASAPASSANAAAANAASGGSTTIQQEDITGVVANVRDSVVTLTSQISTGGGGGGRGFFGGGGGTATGIGTGIVLTSDGYVLTNRHVVEGSQSLKATLADGSEYPASVVTTSDTQDLALVKVDATGLKPATIGNSDEIKVGQTAIAIGSPLGTFTETVTRGIVSALDRSIQVQDEQTGQPVTLSGLIQTDAAINPGNSGGPLLNAAGQVVGVNTATAATAEGIGFAIPIKEAQSLIEQARTASVA